MSPTDPSSAEFDDALQRAGQVFGKAGVAAVYCVHGTFAGGDALGLVTELARFAPAISSGLGYLGKQTVSLVMGESGNYTSRYRSDFQAGISAGAQREIPVQFFNWSSQNNHIGRADGAVHLLCELASLAERVDAESNASDTPARVLLWGHSHGGNVFSLLTNLLGEDPQPRQQFFEAASSFYRSWLGGVDMPAWQKAQEILEDSSHPLRRLKLDIVTFGTPIRYGWNPAGYANLLNFINHRLPPQGIEYQAPVPMRLWPMLTGSDGDYVQQYGIAGSNFPPLPLFVRTLHADLQLDRLLENGLKSESIFKRLSSGARVPNEGTTLLVDYQERGFDLRLMGHALYTRRCWLPFHCREVAARFYEGRV